MNRWERSRGRAAAVENPLLAAIALHRLLLSPEKNTRMTVLMNDGQDNTNEKDEELDQVERQTSLVEPERFDREWDR